MGCGSSSTKEDEEEEEKKRKEDEKKNEDIKQKEKEKEKENEEKQIRDKILKRNNKRSNQPLNEEEFTNHRNPELDSEFGYEDEILDDINLGRPIKILNQTWLTYDFNVIPDTNCPKVTLPRGWRIPTTMDYLILFKNLGELENKSKVFNFLTSPNKLNMSKDYVYVTQSKKYKNIIAGNVKESWIFKCVAFKDFENKIDPNQNLNENDKENPHFNNTNTTMENLIQNFKNKNDVNDHEHVVSDLILNMEKELEMNKLNKNNDDDIIEEEDEENNDDEDVPEIEKEIDIDDLDHEIKDQIVNYISLETNNNNQHQPEEENEILPTIPYEGLYNIFEINTFKYKSLLHCKLIANEVLGVDYLSNIVGETGIEMFFTIPKLFNITTFSWDFGDNSTKSDKRTVKHSFMMPGEYIVKLNLTLFSNRHFILEKNIWIINRIEYGDEEVINDYNYGRPIKIGDQIWMEKDLEFYFDYKMDLINLKRGKGPGLNLENSYIDSVAACPRGWRLPLKEDYEKLLKYGGNSQEHKISFLVMENGFNAKLNSQGIYDAICLDFLTPIKDSPIKRNSLSYNSIYNTIDVSSRSYNKFKQNESNPNLITEKIENLLLDENFLKNLSDYDHMIIKSINFRDIFEKEAYCLRIDNDKTFIYTRSTSMSTYSAFFSTRCIAVDQFDLDIGIKDDYFYVNQKIQFEINHPNIISYEWDFNDSNIDIINKNVNTYIRNPSYTYTVVGEYEIICKLVLFGNRINKIKKTIYIKNEIMKNNDKTKPEKVDSQIFTGFNQIKILNLGEKYKVKRNDMIHFTSQSAPIAMIPNEYSNFYIAFNDMSDLNLKVFKIKIKEILSNDRTSTEDTIYQLEYGVPLDIVATSKGIVLLLKDLRDENSLFIQSINLQGEIQFRNCIMQNGSLPIKAERNQLQFIEPETEKPVFGMNTMHKPYSGRLSYGNGKILVIFSHNNYFGSSKGEREDHSADTIITYSEDGMDVNLAVNWSTSHSLTQRAIFDGRFFFTASLGDALPHNIKVVRVDPVIRFNLKNGNHNRNLNRNLLINSPDLKYDRLLPLNTSEMELMKPKMNLRHDFIYSSIIKGIIPGDMRGKSSGRLSDIIQIDQDLFALVYSRISCQDSGEINHSSEFGVVFFNSNLKVLSTSLFFKGDLISCIKSAKFGENLLIMFSKTKKRIDQKYIIDYCLVEEEFIDNNNPNCNSFLIDYKGQLISKIFNYPISPFSPPDDLETLDDGSVVWVFIDDENNLNICLLLNNEIVEDNLNSPFTSLDKYTQNYINKKKEEKLKNQILERKRLKEMEIRDLKEYGNVIDDSKLITGEEHTDKDNIDKDVIGETLEYYDIDEDKIKENYDNKYHNHDNNTERQYDIKLPKKKRNLDNNYYM